MIGELALRRRRAAGALRRIGGRGGVHALPSGANRAMIIVLGVQDALGTALGENVMIGSILTGKKPLVSVTRDTRVSAITALLYTHRIGAVLVMQDGEIHGLVSERDICAGLHTHGAAILDAMAAEIMSSPVVTAHPHETVAQAMETMTDRRFRHLPVVEGGRILGLVSIGDLVKARIEEAESEAQAMKAYIAS